MPATGGVQTFHVIGWIVTALAFAGTLVWNYLNRVHTNNLASDIRKEQYNISVWDRYRTKIERDLEDLVSLVDSLPAQVGNLPEGANIDAYLGHMSHACVTAQDDLSRALANAAKSPHCENTLDWLNAALGSQIGTESSWDNLLATFESASKASEKDECIACLKELRRYVLEIEDAVQERIRSQDYLFEPPGGKSS